MGWRDQPDTKKHPVHNRYVFSVDSMLANYKKIGMLAKPESLRAIWSQYDNMQVRFLTGSHTATILTAGLQVPREWCKENIEIIDRRKD